MHSSFFINMSVSHLFFSKNTVKDKDIHTRGTQITTQISQWKGEPKLYRVAICLKLNCQGEKLITVVAWATLITNSTLWHKAKREGISKRQEWKGKCDMQSELLRLSFWQPCVWEHSFGKTSCFNHESVWLIPMIRENLEWTLTFSSFIMILVLTGWPELLSMLWCYNPRDSTASVSNVL